MQLPLPRVSPNDMTQAAAVRVLQAERTLRREPTAENRLRRDEAINTYLSSVGRI